MPEVRQRDPHDKIKTKGKNCSGRKNRKSNVTQQVKTAVEQKVRQRQENEASNEYAVTTTEQAVSEAVGGAAELAGKAAHSVYSKSVRLRSTEPDMPTSNSEAYPETADTPVAHPSQHLHTSQDLPKSVSQFPEEQGRKLAAQSHGKIKAEGAAVHSVQGEPIRTPPANAPKTRPQVGFGSQSAPKIKDAVKRPVNDPVVEQGRRLAVQSHIQKQAEKAAASQVQSAETYHTPVSPEAVTQIGISPKAKDAADPLSRESSIAVPQHRINEMKGQRQLQTAELKVSSDQHNPSKDKLGPRQKPKVEPKTRRTVEKVAPKAVRPEKGSSSAPVLTNAQKAVEMGRRKFMKESQKKMIQQAQRAARIVADLAKKAAIATAKAIKATVSMLASIFGGVGLAVILIVILLIGAILASPFGILFSNEPSPGAIPLSSAVAQISMEFSTELNELQEGEYEEITIEGEPPDWKEVIAVFACHVAGGKDGVDVMVLNEEKVDKLRTVFWDMCIITSEEETEEWTGPTIPTDVSTEPSITLSITIEAKTADDMRTIYAFSESQNDALTELLAEEEMLNSLIGDLDISQGDALELLNGLPGEVSETRKAVVRQALTLVGKVNYFWGGKSLVIGWDNRWGQPTEVWAAGSPSTGTIRPYGLDCSGFIDWVFYNVSGGSYVLGHGGGVATQRVYCQEIMWDQAQPGDLVFYPDDSHVGIVGGRDEAGNILVIHCASGMNNVVITGSSGFGSVGRPYYYGE